MIHLEIHWVLGKVSGFTTATANLRCIPHATPFHYMFAFPLCFPNLGLPSSPGFGFCSFVFSFGKSGRRRSLLGRNWNKSHFIHDHPVEINETKKHSVGWVNLRSFWSLSIYSI